MGQFSDQIEANLLNKAARYIPTKGAVKSTVSEIGAYVFTN